MHAVGSRSGNDLRISFNFRGDLKGILSPFSLRFLGDVLSRSRQPFAMLLGAHRR